MTIHDDFLNTIGMVTNVGKTELIYFDRKKKEGNPLTVKPQLIKPNPAINVLSILFEKDLSWDTQIKKVPTKTRQILRQLKFLKKYLSTEDMSKITTSYLFGLL